MRKIIIPFFLIFSFVVVGQTPITKNLGDFSILKIYNGIRVNLVKASAPKIIITGKNADRVKVKNNNGTLKISLKFPNILAKKDINVTLNYTKQMRIIDANEGASITCKNLRQNQVEIKAQEGSFINISLQTKHLTVKSVTGSVVKLSGATDNQRVTVRNSGIYHGYNMKTKGATIVNATLGGKAEVSVKKTLEAIARVGGSVFYKGNPEVLKDKKSLGGVISAKN